MEERSQSPTTLCDEIKSAINRCSAENESNTPDFILAEFLTDCLASFDKATNARRDWRKDGAIEREVAHGG